MTDSLSAHFGNRTVAAYLTALSSGSPAPGGGSAVGLAGALGCALGSMVCNLTLAREPLESASELVAAFGELQADLLHLSEADERVFAAYRDATTLPRTTDEEKATRRAAVEAALVAAAEVPLQMATLGLEALAALRAAAVEGTRHALGDLLTGGFLIQAMVLGSIENISANAMLMKEEENRTRFERAATSATVDLATAIGELQQAVAARLS